MLKSAKLLDSLILNLVKIFYEKLDILPYGFPIPLGIRVAFLFAGWRTTSHLLLL